MSQAISKDEFIASYCTKSGFSLDIFAKYFVALPCRCGDDSCHGWAAVSNDPWSIRIHAELYGNGVDKAELGC